jgi:hypothetical protein
MEQPDYAEEIRAIAKVFGVAGDAVVTFERDGRPPVRLPLEDLLKRLERPAAKQQRLFDPE